MRENFIELVENFEFFYHLDFFKQSNFSIILIKIFIKIHTVPTKPLV